MKFFSNPLTSVKAIVFFGLLLISSVVTAQCNFTISTSITNVTCYMGTNGSVTATVTGGTAPYQYQLSEAGAGAWQTPNSFTALGAGTYPLSVRDATGCIKTIYITVTQPAALVTTYTATDATCAGSNNGSITTSTSGGVSPYTYSWTKDGSAFSTTPNISGLSPANYLITVTDASGCITTPAIISQVRPISLTGFNEDVIANGTNVAATASTTNPVDLGNNVFYASGYSNSNATGTAGLPASGSFTSAQDNARAYQFASYSSSNSMILRSSAASTTYGGATSGTFTFASPNQSPYATLYVLGTTGNGTGNINYTVTYSDATNSTGSLTFQDWYLTPATASAQRALGNLDRVSWVSPGTFTGSTNFNLFESPITIPLASQNKVINSVSFTWAGTSDARINLFAVTGYTSTLSIRINNGPSSGVIQSVSVSSDAVSNTFCSGQNVTFTATPVNAGNSPTYQWKLNGANVGTNSPTYSNNALTNGALVTVSTTSTLSCLTSATAAGNTITMTLGGVTPAVSVSSTGNSICSGTSTVFTATPTNGGNTPAYQWKLNNANVGTNSPTYSNSALSGNDVVSAVMTSSIGCTTGNPVTSNTVTMNVTANGTPTVSISSVPAIRFSSAVTVGGTTPSYQWFKNGSILSGATSPTLNVSSPTIGDLYSMKLTSNYACKTAPAAMSNYITVTAATLPVVLESFTLSTDKSKVLLKWKTAIEVQNKQFLVQRTTPPSSLYQTIGIITASVNSQDQSYSFTDEPGFAGTYMYQLVQQDVDGKQTILGVRTATMAAGSNWQVADLKTSWKLQSSEPLRYFLADEAGRLIETGTSNGTTLIQKPLSGSVFVLKIEYKGKSFSRKLVK